MYAALHVCYGPVVAEVRRDDDGERWCFVCRKRRRFDFVMMAPTEPSYYGPHVFIECERGHADGDLFPGRVREWEEP